MSRKAPQRGNGVALTLLIACVTLGGTACASGAVVSSRTRVAEPSRQVTPTTQVARSKSEPPTTASPIAATQELVSLLQPHEARSKPGSGSKSLGLVPARTPITEERTVLPVLAHTQHWLKVRLPGRPNGHAGWINRTASHLWATDWHISLDLSRRKVVVYRASKPVRTFLAVIGKPSTPTPTGHFFVEESLALRPTDLGAPFALALSARSDVFQEFAGGPGQIAIHGVNNIGGVLGTAVSHGCVRLSGAAMRWLVYHVKPGVPVTITS
jgi:lipoprotein-anchoring transpeptidase ErfK/SrfK